MSRSLQGPVALLRDTVASRLGLHLEHERLAELEAIIDARRRQLRLRDPSDYVRLVAASREGSEELAWLASRLTVSETYFFRDGAQLEIVAGELARLEAVEPDGTIEVLSAGCATGEEAYTVAMLALERLIQPSRMRVVGVDVDAAAIRRAEAGRYGPWALRQTDVKRRARHFSRSHDGYVVGDGPRQLVRFARCNLSAPHASIWQPEAFDIILCRNVLMYLRPEVVAAIGAGISRALRPGGLLLLGHADRMRRDDLTICAAPGAFYFRRAPAPKSPWESAAAPHISPDERRPVAAPKPRSRTRPSRGEASLTTATPDLLLSLVAADRLKDALAAYDASPEVGLPAWMRAALLADLGAVDEALARCDEILEADGLDADAHFVQAICLERKGETAAAMARAHAAAYLDRRFALPHLHLGRQLRRLGQREEARRELALALGLLPHENDLRVLFFGARFDRGALMASCRGELSLVRG